MADMSFSEPLTIPLSSIVECDLLAEDDDDVSTAERTFIKKNNARLLQIFADGKKRRFTLPATSAESASARLVQWIQAVQERIAADILTQSAIDRPPLLTQDDTASTFKGDSDILSLKDVLYLQYKMPDRHAMERWEMVYSTTRHGISINTFYTKVAQRAPSIIVVEDINRHVFGCYASEPWVKSNQSHYGNGESFLFKLKPLPKVYKWSKINDYFMYSSKDFISMGGGGAGYGLWLDKDFENGSTATSDTFLNEPLSLSEQFTVLKVEVWSVPIFYKKKTARPLD